MCEEDIEELLGITEVLGIINKCVLSSRTYTDNKKMTRMNKISVYMMQTPNKEIWQEESGSYVKIYNPKKWGIICPL